MPTIKRKVTTTQSMLQLQQAVQPLTTYFLVELVPNTHHSKDDRARVVTNADRRPRHATAKDEHPPLAHDAYHEHQALTNNKNTPDGRMARTAIPLPHN